MLYELLTGGKLFKGDDAADTLAQVLAKEPDLEKAPPQVRKLLRRCLEKDPRQRLRDIGEARYLLEDPVATAAAVPGPSRLGRTVPWAIAAVALLVGVSFALIDWRAKPPLPISTSFEIAPPAGQNIVDAGLSSDGRQVALIVTSPTEGRKLMIRRWTTRRYGWWRGSSRGPYSDRRTAAKSPSLRATGSKPSIWLADRFRTCAPPTPRTWMTGAPTA